MRRILFAMALAGTALSADLEYFGVQKMGDGNVANKLRMRFKASGEPLFLLRDAHAGIAIGDMIRFADKAVLVDANVMQSLAQDGALRSLGSSRIVKLKATGKSSVWKSRASASAGLDRNGYRLGQEILKVLEENFGGMPRGERLVLEFDGSYLAIAAPGSLLARLKSTAVRRDEPKPTPLKTIPKPQEKPKPKPKGVPQFVSPAPLPVRLGQDLDWQAWAVDSEHPSDQLSYRLVGNLPEGLSWDPSLHRLQGKPAIAGNYSLRALVRNPNSKEDTLNFDLVVAADSLPQIQESDLPEALRGQMDWSVQLSALDADDKSSDLKWSLVDGPRGMILDSTGLLQWYVPDQQELGGVPLKVKVVDPWGGSAEKDWNLSVVSTRERMKAAAVELSLPRDTLVQNHCLKWIPRWTSTANARLLRVSGTQDVIWNQNVLKYCPSLAGVDTLSFEFDVEGKPLLLSKALVIQPNQSPQWLFSSLPRVNEGESLRLLAPVYDPEGDSLQVQILTQPGDSYDWDGKQLILRNLRRGHHGIEWKANDGHGAESSVRTDLWVQAPRAEINRLSVRNLRQSSQSWWDLNYQRDAARFGLFSTDLSEHIYWQTQTDSLTGKSKEIVKSPEDLYYPYLYAGASLLGSDAAAGGNFLFTDLGLTFRPLSDKIVGGGMMLRLQGQWQSADQKDRAQMEWLLSIKQGVVLTLDTRAQKAREQMSQCLSNGDVDCINNVLVSNPNLFAGCQRFDENNEQCVEAITTFGLGKGIDRVLSSTASTWNVVHMLKFEYGRRVADLNADWGSIWLGPAAWRRDVVLKPWFEEFLGLGAHWTGKYGSLHWDLGSSVGYGLAHTEWTTAEKADFQGLYSRASVFPQDYLGTDWRYKTLEGMRILMDVKLSWGQ